MLGSSLQLVSVEADGQTFTGMYRVRDGVLRLKFAGHEVIGRVKDNPPEEVAHRLLRNLLLQGAAQRLREASRRRGFLSSL